MPNGARLPAVVPGQQPAAYEEPLVISPDLAVVGQVSDRIGVLYHGELVELALTQEDGRP